MGHRKLRWTYSKYACSHIIIDCKFRMGNAGVSMPLSIASPMNVIGHVIAFVNVVW